MLHDAHVNSLIFWAESNGSIYRIPRSHLDGAGGQFDQGQGGVHHVKIEPILTNGNSWLAMNLKIYMNPPLGLKSWYRMRTKSKSSLKESGRSS